MYGYALPICGSLLVASMPHFFDLQCYISIVSVFHGNISLIFGFIAFILTVSIPFQVKVIAEDSEIVLKVLDGTEVRAVFKDALHYQAYSIIIFGLILLLASTIFPNKHWVGFLLLFCVSFVGFESLCMISNGRAYTDLREKILLKTAKAKMDAGSHLGS